LTLLPLSENVLHVLTEEFHGRFFRAWNEEAQVILWRRFLRDSTSASLAGFDLVPEGLLRGKGKSALRNLSGTKRMRGNELLYASVRISPLPRAVIPWRPDREISSIPLFLWPW